MIFLAKAAQISRAGLAALLLGAVLGFGLPAWAWADTPAEQEAVSQIYAIYANGQGAGGNTHSDNEYNGNNIEENPGGVYEPTPGYLEPEPNSGASQTTVDSQSPANNQTPANSQTPDNNQNSDNNQNPDNNQNLAADPNQAEPPELTEPAQDFPPLSDSLQVLLWQAEDQVNRRTEVVPVHLALRGEYLPSDVPAMAVSGRTLVPVRLISEQMQASVAWEKATNTVTVSQGGKTIVLTIGSSTALVDGRPVQVPDKVSVSLVTYHGTARTMVPVRFVVENLAASVNYDQARRVVNIIPPLLEPTEPGEEPPAEPLPEIIPPPGLDENGNLLRRVVVDPGHGGSDPGTNGSGREEKSVNLEVSLKLQTALENLGYEVIMARSADDYVSLLDRAALTVQADAPVFVSVHCNSAANIPSANGIETYAAPEDKEDAALAAYIQRELIAATGAKDRGVKTSSLVVLTHNVAPACLVEIGFMSNKEECAKITAQVYQQKLAEAIAAGVEAYFSARAEENAAA
ncbi:MAG: N-acetylmuramoyl-L-alanine amidase [Clostridium sp.]|nr:N-acetylmuramoyl-L-alanine amidase [Clostridium sp.]